MGKFVEWYSEHGTKVAWWVLGWLSFSLVDCLLRENFELALITAILIYMNYKLWKNNNA